MTVMGSSGHISAAQLSYRDNTSCPFSNGSTYNDPTSMQFEILCNTDIQTNDLCLSGDATCSSTADSMQDCISLCVTTHPPLCQAVVWHPTTGACTTKAADAANVSDFTIAATDPPLHAAFARLPTLNDACSEGEVLNTSSGKHFKVQCNQDRVGSDLGTSFHTDTLEDCIGNCSTFHDPHPFRKCVGVVWDPTMRYGFTNCYEKSSTPAPDEKPLLVVAFVTDEPVTDNTGNDDGANDGTSGDSGGSGGNGVDDGPDGSSGKAWIAGVVLGIVALIAILAGLFWFYRRRQRSKQRQVNDRTAAPVHEADGIEAVRFAKYKSPSEADGRGISEINPKTVPVELDAR